MRKIERLLCRVGIHKWAAWESTQIPLVPILGIHDMALDGQLIDSDKLAIETKSRICTRCRNAQIASILHW